MVKMKEFFSWGGHFPNVLPQPTGLHRGGFRGGGGKGDSSPPPPPCLLHWPDPM